MLHTRAAHSFAVLAVVSHLSAVLGVLPPRAVTEPIPAPLAVLIQHQELHRSRTQKHIPVAWHVGPGYAM